MTQRHEVSACCWENGAIKLKMLIESCLTQDCHRHSICRRQNTCKEQQSEVQGIEACPYLPVLFCTVIICLHSFMVDLTSGRLIPSSLFLLKIFLGNCIFTFPGEFESYLFYLVPTGISASYQKYNHIFGL